MSLYIIAEAGINHNGDISIAKQLIEAASKSGADAVKFQAALPELVCTRQSPLAKYQQDNESLSQFKLLSELHLPLEAYDILNEYAISLGIEFICSAFDCTSLDYINNLGVKRHKIASGEINHYPFIEQIASYNKPTILSTGMATMNEVDDCYQLLLKGGLDPNDIVIMHCTTQYPTDFNHVNINAVKTIQKHFKCQIGYSDHTIGNEISLIALGMGCNYFEKHFTLDKNFVGPDHKASLSVEELNSYVRVLREGFSALGNGVKKPTNIEKEHRIIVRRSIYAKTSIKQGDIFSDKNIICKRPAYGINPIEWKNIIGEKAIKDFAVDDLISLS